MLGVVERGLGGIDVAFEPRPVDERDAAGEELAAGGGAHADAERLRADLALEVAVDLDEVRADTALHLAAGGDVDASAEVEVALEPSEHVEVTAGHASGHGAAGREHGQILLGNH